MDDLVAKALGLFSGPDYLSNGKEASFANMPTQDETTADFFKADRAARLAREIEALPLLLAFLLWVPDFQLRS